MWRKLIVIASVSLSTVVLLSSCEDKVIQCQQLIQVVNAGNSLIDQNKGEQVITSWQLSQDLQVITKSLKELKLSDPKLKEFKTDFVSIFDNLSQAIAKASQGLGAAKNTQPSTEGREKLQEARIQIDTSLTSAENAGKKFDALATELNQYCGQSQ